MGSQQKRQTYIVICEGKSDEAYLIELSKFFEENDINVGFIPHDAGSGIRSIIEGFLREKLRKNGNKISKFILFLDKDIYLRDPSKNTPSDCFKSLYHFNTYCFEDFLVLHLEKSKVENWSSVSLPDADRTTKIEKLLVEKGIFLKYRKGELPPGFEFSYEMLERLIANCNDATICFKSDFVTKILCKHFPISNAKK